ncbi:MAG TPA: FliG C-terminal domain-containing protein [Pirellulaceae bacterium]|jgi:flagellar motor switch protein FliG
MSQLPPSLRKAAVLISALNEREADALLQQMSADDAAKVRSALVELQDISAEEQQQVLAEFLTAQNRSQQPEPDDGGVDLDISPAVEAAIENYVPPEPQKVIPAATDDRPSFDFLADVDAKAIATVLSRELPQTIAVVIAHLPPEKGAAVLELLPPVLATEALERIAWLDQLAPAVQADLARELRRQLAPHLRLATGGPGWLPHVNAVLGAMDFRQRQRLVVQLGQRNQTLLDRLGLFPTAHGASNDQQVVSMRYRIDSEPETAPSPSRRQKLNSDEQTWLTFDDLVQLDDRALRTIFASAETEMALLALTGAEPRLIARILRKLPANDAATLRHRLEHPGPLRLRDVEQARAAVAAVASRLAHEGTIQLPASVRFAAAV